MVERKKYPYPECKECIRSNRDNAGVEVICGPMRSWKSGKLISLLREAMYSKEKVVAFQPEKDDRRGMGSINTFDGDSFPATAVATAKEILELVSDDVDVVGIDEGNLFDDELEDVVNELAERGFRVIVAGLELNFRGEGFGAMAKLKLTADVVTQLSARCEICGKKASRTQRFYMVDGEKVPAPYDDVEIIVGEKEYEPRCRKHHEVPRGLNNK